jgi:hypothetical protein
MIFPRSETLEIHRKINMNPIRMIQIYVNSLFQYLSTTTACMIFRALEIICDLFVVDLGFYLHKSKSEVVCDEND